MGSEALSFAGRRIAAPPPSPRRSTSPLQRRHRPYLRACQRARRPSTPPAKSAPDKRQPPGGAEMLHPTAAPMVPHLAEECWLALRIRAYWPNSPGRPGPGLLAEDTVVIAVQVNGKRLRELRLQRDAAKEDIEAAARKLDNVVRHWGRRSRRLWSYRRGSPWWHRPLLAALAVTVAVGLAGCGIQPARPPAARGSPR